MNNLESPRSMLEFYLGWYLGLYQEMIMEPASDDDIIFDAHFPEVCEMQQLWREKYKDEIVALMDNPAGGDSFENFSNS